jgi:porin
MRQVRLALGVTLAVCAPLQGQTGRPVAADAASVHDIEFSNFDSDLSPGEATTVATAELAEIYGPNEGYFDRWGFNRPLDLLVDPLDKLYRETGLRLGAAYTMLYLQSMGGQAGGQARAGGDIDFMSSWTLIGRGTEDTGRLVFTGEYRFGVDDYPPSTLGRQMGTLIPPTNTFNSREWVVRDAYWIQRLFDARVRILIGRADPSDYVGAYWMQNVNNSFVNRHLSANPAIPFPGHGPMLGLSLRPTPDYYLTGGAANAYSNTEFVEIDSVFEYWDLFSFVEAGYTPTLTNLGPGRYAVGVWHMPQRDRTDQPEDYGFTLIADQRLSEDLQVFARYGYTDGTLTNIRHLGQTGLGFSGLGGRQDDLTGLAFSLAVPVSSASRNESVIETFHRFQMTANTQFSVGLQLIADPSNATAAEPAGVFYARLRVSF